MSNKWKKCRRVCLYVCIVCRFMPKKQWKNEKRVIINRDSIFCGMRFKKKNQFKPLIKREWKVFKFKRMGYKQKVYNFQVFLIMLDCNLVKKLFYVIQCFCNKSLWLDPSSVLHQVSGFKVKIFGFSSLNILWCWNIFVSNKKTFLHGKVLVNLMSNCHSPLHAYQFTLIELIGSVGARAKLLSEINKGKGWGNHLLHRPRYM